MGKSRKRKYTQNPSSANPTASIPSEEPPALPIVKFGQFKLTMNSGVTRSPTPPNVASTEDEDGGGWERAGKRQKKNKPQRKGNVPEMALSPQKLKSPVRLADLQNLVIWLVADGVAPQWLMVRVGFLVLSLLCDFWRSDTIRYFEWAYGSKR